ncbi:MAG: hypothetical protein WDW36_004410 [Sanguina aurantia]
MPEQCRSSLRITGSAAVVASLAAAVLLLSGITAPPAADAVTVEQLLFLEAWRAVDRAYVDKDFNGQTWFRVREAYLKKETMNNRAQTYTAVRKLLASLDDPFTRLLEPERLAALRRGTAGSVTGVGVELTLDAQPGKLSELVVVTPLLGGPADVAGIRAGDFLVEIAGHPTAGLSLYEASDLLLGDVGSEVQISVRSGKKPVKQLTLIRQKLTISPVSYTSCGVVSPTVGLPKANAEVAYIRLATFSTKTAEALREAITEAQTAGKAGIVLDIRNNGGGSFPAGVQVARQLMDKGDIVLIADAGGVRDVYSADGKALDKTTPLTVLVNKGTASASEVLAGALKDSRRATIAGSTTFGKGLIQTVVDLSDGSGMAITVARYQTPAGVDINKIGIEPDIALQADALPTDGPGVCRVLSSPTAPRIF